MTLRAAVTFAVVLVTVALAPLAAEAQTGSLWHNQKLNDMKAHQRGQDYDNRANQHYQLAVDHVRDLQRLLAEDELSRRQEKRLDRAYRKATSHLEQVVEVEPEWLEAHLLLGSVHYKMEDYAAAKTAFEGVLSLDPEHQDAQAYLSSAQWHLDHPEETALGGGGSR
jgi:tetratricopeptide (TPR) repeat protein